MPTITLDHLTDENRRHLDLRREFERELLLAPERFWPYLRPCTVDVLVVVDGLDFSEANFGLATFIRTLLDMPGRYVRFKITLAHVFSADAAMMMGAEARIHNRITGFRFDNPSHFTTEMYDVVFLFGVATSYAGRGIDSNGNPSPEDRLSDTELRALTLFMNAKGGLFATGDHGALGRPLCHAVPRARNMRLWQSTTGQASTDEVSMGGPRRNDTNRLGDAGSQFNDQSDDVPQDIQPKIYTRRSGLMIASFPHPLLCGPSGMIRVMPDHPHEGECVEPANPNLDLNILGPLGREYPDSVGGGARPLPEIISTSSVLSGTTSSGKDPTIAQSFGGICAYDGHRAGIGRVVTDATWHHFVNVNLVGDTFAPAGSLKRLGFLATPAGQAHFEAIKAYFRNLAVWLSPPDRIACMNSRLLWSVVWNDRVMEAVLSTVDIRIADLRLSTLRLIGRHARDVLGNYVGACQSVKLAIDLVFERALPSLIPEIDPWFPGLEQMDIKSVDRDDLAWFDGSPLIDIAIGGAIVSLREAVRQPDEKSVANLDSDVLQRAIAKGGAEALERAVKSITRKSKDIRTSLKSERLATSSD